MERNKPETANTMLMFCYSSRFIVSTINIYQVESGNPGESKELRNAREKFNRVFGVSLGEEDRLVILKSEL